VRADFAEELSMRWFEWRRLANVGLGALLACAGASALDNKADDSVQGVRVQDPQVVLEQSEISFISHQMGVPVAGHFRKFDAQVHFDPGAPEKSHFLIGVDLASVQLPTNDAMREVVKPVWFDAQRFPRAVFESSSVRFIRPGQYEVLGHLNIKGRARTVVVPVMLERSGALTLASGSLNVQRLAFAIGDGDWSDTSVVADEVQINFRLALRGLPGG
jgi:polyisoprenoid-binding protein YceI